MTIIVVTGHVTIDDVHPAREVRCEDLVSKPIDLHVLIDKVREHLPQDAAGTFPG